MIATEPETRKQSEHRRRLMIEMLTAIQAAADDQLRKRAAFVILVTRRKEPPRGEHVKLCGKIGPRGELRCCTRDGSDWRIVAAYDPANVVRFCTLTIQELCK